VKTTGEVNDSPKGDRVHDAIIIGAGLAGLVAAKSLIAQGLDVVVLEADDRPGGRLKTDRVNGFLLDHGFQVYLTSYQTAGQILDLKSLGLKSFQPGAMVRCSNRWHTVKDPLRSPPKSMLWDAIKTIASPIANWEDLWTLFRYRQGLMKLTAQEILERPGIQTIDRLRQIGFSERIIDRFFRPFLGGIFLDDSLSMDSSRMEFVFREMSLGTAALPMGGIQSIPESLCKDWKPGVLRLRSTVAACDQESVITSDAKRVRGHKILVATEATGAKRLLGARLAIAEPLAWNGTTCMYFSIDRHAAPTREPILFLNGNLPSKPSGFSINHVAFPSLVQPSYAPGGKVLASVSINGHIETSGKQLIDQVQNELEHWFGWTVSRWEHLRTYSVPCAFSNPSDPLLPSPQRGLYKIENNLFACGDYTTTASIEGAMQSGLLAAQAILESI
jgi:phytoene dehydrogenase-like protein